MASKRLLVLAVVLCCISSISRIKGQNLSKPSHPEYKFVLGGLLTSELQSRKLAGSITVGSNKSSGSTIEGPLIEVTPHGFTHVAGYQSRGAYYNTWWHGVRAKMTVWALQDVQPLSDSSAYIAAVNTDTGSEMVVAGVHVYPQLYNNSYLRFFTYWRTTKENIEVKSCYNTLCPGFVIANGSNLLPGQGLSPLSEYGGKTRYITLRIKKDEKTGDWSLYREDQGGPIGGMTLLGWWPQSLFKSLSDRANIIEWIGEVNYQKNERGPSMGSGHFPNERVGQAASFYDIFGFDYDGTIYKDFYRLIPWYDRPGCYNIAPWSDSGKPEYRHFYYGGPSGCFQ